MFVLSQTKQIFLCPKSFSPTAKGGVFKKCTVENNLKGNKINWKETSRKNEGSHLEIPN